MTEDRPLGPLREKMIAALYGELGTGELRRFEESLAADETLRAEWEELRGTRNFLTVAGVEEDEAEFSFTLPLSLPRPEQKVRGQVVRGPWRRWGAALSGFSAAAAIFAVLLFSGLRVDRTADGWLIGFSGAPGTQSSLEPSSTGGPAGPTTADGSDVMVTRADFTAFARELVEATDQRLTRMEDRRSGEQAVLVRGFLDALSMQQQELSLRQQRNYEDLRARVELVAYGLAASQQERPGQRQQRSRQTLNPVEED